MNPSIYDHPSIKTTNKKFKSVFISREYFEDCLIVAVEAYDDIGYNALNTTIDEFDTFYDEINKIIIENFTKINSKTNNIRVIIHSDIYPTEYILTKDGQRF